MISDSIPHLVLVCLVATAPAFVSGCDTEASEMRDEREVAPTPVDTLVLSPTDFVDTFPVIGRTEPAEAVEVSSDVPGMVLEAYVAEGDDVDTGDPLFRIDTEADEAGQQVLETEVEAAERELQRLERLAAEGLATEQQVDNARTDLERARRNLRQSQVTIDRNVVKSPIDGRVATRMIDTGEFAGAGVPLVEVVDLDPVVVEAQVPESELRYVDDRQQPLDVDIPALDTTVEATVDHVAVRPSPNTRTYTVELHIDNDDGRIRSGMRSRVHFERRRYEDVIVIPRDSILEGYDRREVMVVPGDEDIGDAEVRVVTTGPGTRDDVVVESGLDTGDRLILRGHRGLLADARIEVVDEAVQGQEDDS